MESGVAKTPMKHRDIGYWHSKQWPNCYARRLSQKTWLSPSFCGSGMGGAEKLQVSLSHKNAVAVMSWGLTQLTRYTTKMADTAVNDAKWPRYLLQPSICLLFCWSKAISSPHGKAGLQIPRGTDHREPSWILATILAESNHSIQPANLLRVFVTDPTAISGRQGVWSLLPWNSQPQREVGR